MNNNLPNVYHGSVTSDSNMSREVISNQRCYEKEVPQNINTKLNNIFKSNTFVYKKIAKVTLKDGSSKIITIVGKSGNNIITLDQGNININDILNITI